MQDFTASRQSRVPSGLRVIQFSQDLQGFVTHIILQAEYCNADRTT